jgi:hypothetical protein
MPEFESDPIDNKSAGGGAPAGAPVESTGSAARPVESTGSAPKPAEAVGNAPDPGDPGRPPRRPDEQVGDAPSPGESVGNAPARTGGTNLALIVGGAIALIAIIAVIFGVVVK